MRARNVMVATGLLLLLAGPLAAGQRNSFSWSTRDATYRVSYDGDIEFTADDRDVKSISPGGYLKLSDGGWFGGKGVDFRADASGRITRRYRVSIIEKPFEPEGRAWLQRLLPAFIRESGIGARARVARILKAQGVPGVLSEISRIEGSWGKRAYFTELLRSGPLDAATVALVLQQAGREVRSDYELAMLLLSAQHLLTDDATRRAYFDAAATIHSDYELQRVLSGGITAGPVPPAMLAGTLHAATTIDSDYELASLLLQVARHQPLDPASQRAFFMALDTVGSDYEHQRVLTALGARGDLPDDLVAAMLRSATRIQSDYEEAQFLKRLAKQRPIDGRIRAPFFAAVDAVQSSFERAQVLQTVARHPDAPPETIVSVIRAAADIGSGHERSQVLLAVAAGPPLSGPARSAYIAAAEQLGEYEQGQVLTALVRNERGKQFPKAKEPKTK